MEPRNFGVVVWSNGAIISRFAGETTVGGRSVIRPPAHLHMESANAYRQWVDYWRLMMSRSTIKGSDGVARKRSDPEFVEILSSATNTAQTERRYVAAHQKQVSAQLLH